MHTINELKTAAERLKPNSEEDWDRLREIIGAAKSILDDNNITIYNDNLTMYYNLTWNGSKNGSKKNFEIAVSEIKSTLLNASIKYPHVK